MTAILITAAITITALCALAFKVAKREDERMNDLNRRLKELEQNKTEDK